MLCVSNRRGKNQNNLNSKQINQIIEVSKNIHYQVEIINTYKILGYASNNKNDTNNEVCEKGRGEINVGERKRRRNNSGLMKNPLIFMNEKKQVYNG